MTEIGGIARFYLERHAHRAPILIEDQISRAIGARGWDEVAKWQRVKLRVERLLQLSGNPVI